MSGFSKLLLLISIQRQIFCVFGIDPRIVGGKECDYELYPYAVAVFSPDPCGGTIITLDWILTAAQCINVTKISAGTVILRTGFSRDEKFIQKRSVIKGIAHDWFKYEVKYDIGLMKADKPFEQTSYLEPARLPYVGFESKCKTVTAIGIGEEKILAPNETGSKVIRINESLLCVEMPILNRSECPGTYDLYIDEATICTMAPGGGKSTCYGDSGSPIVCEDVVIGITNGGMGCGQAGFPYYSTTVEYFWDFITKHTNIQPPPSPTTRPTTATSTPHRQRKHNVSNKCLPGNFILFTLFFILCNAMFKEFGYL